MGQQGRSALNQWLPLPLPPTGVLNLSRYEVTTYHGAAHTLWKSLLWLPPPFRKRPETSSSLLYVVLCLHLPRLATLLPSCAASVHNMRDVNYIARFFLPTPVSEREAQGATPRGHGSHPWLSCLRLSWPSSTHPSLARESSLTTFSTSPFYRIVCTFSLQKCKTARPVRTLESFSIPLNNLDVVCSHSCACTCPSPHQRPSSRPCPHQPSARSAYTRHASRISDLGTNTYHIFGKLTEPGPALPRWSRI